MNYSDAKRVLEGRSGFGYARKLAKPNPSRRVVKVANNTYLEWRDTQIIALCLHGADVLTFTPHYVELDSCGWPTMTTRNRLDYGPVRVAATRGGWSVFPHVELPCFCVTDADNAESRYPALRGEYAPGLRPEFTDEWTGEPYDHDNGSKPIYEWRTCSHCQGSARRIGIDWDSGGYAFFDGIRVRPDGSGILATQPKRPRTWEPVRTVSGFTGGFHGYGMHRSMHGHSLRGC